MSKRLSKHCGPVAIIVGPQGEKWCITTRTAVQLGLCVGGCAHTGNLKSMVFAVATRIRFLIEREEVVAGKDCRPGRSLWMSGKSKLGRLLRSNMRRYRFE